MRPHIIPDSDNEDSESEHLTNRLLDWNLSMAKAPTCTPPVYNSSEPVQKSGKYKYYNVYWGSEPGCYKDWADASGRVTNFKGNRHKGYDTWEQALDGWRQNCRAYHLHPTDFVDGTMYSSVSCTEREEPRPMTPPPSRHNISDLRTGNVSPTKTPFRRVPTEPVTSTPSASSRSSELDEYFWAIHSPAFNGLVSSALLADEYLARANRFRQPVSMLRVTSVAEAERWLSSMDLEDQ
ncbi:hypothetical protein F5878DRAFT_632187 [Lentinula raphanica]|uniref:Ribonuclease H1 N-terminal domain-containing protein n=1 Tax=Lentinula raphanica TaxID=153919 RepID=A0AA38NZZ3_9AGAR|nr:hypothetical protein F5880DRAFT_1617947 [Lentinula raphanica]KAJ3833752.1 hypothetical protein F5878DRAFT_632187 [Lentinula raphanica]